MIRFYSGTFTINLSKEVGCDIRKFRVQGNDPKEKTCQGLLLKWLMKFTMSATLSRVLLKKISVVINSAKDGYKRKH